MLQRIGKPPLRGKAYVLRPGAYAILPLKQRFLMTAQLSPRVDVQLPGGGIDPGESPQQALFREVREEIGWSISRLRRLGAFRRFVYMPEYDLWAEKLCHVYVAHPVRQIADPTEPDHATVVLSAQEALASLGNNGDRLFLKRYISRAP